MAGLSRVSRETERLAREIVRADDRVAVAASRYAWDEVETWTDTRNELRRLRSEIMRSQWLTGEWVWPEPIREVA